MRQKSTYSVVVEQGADGWLAGVREITEYGTSKIHWFAHLGATQPYPFVASGSAIVIARHWADSMAKRQDAMQALRAAISDGDPDDPE